MRKKHENRKEKKRRRKTSLHVSTMRQCFKRAMGRQKSPLLIKALSLVRGQKSESLKPIHVYNIYTYIYTHTYIYIYMYVAPVFKLLRTQKILLPLPKESDILANPRLPEALVDGITPRFQKMEPWIVIPGFFGEWLRPSVLTTKRVTQNGSDTFHQGFLGDVYDDIFHPHVS